MKTLLFSLMIVTSAFAGPGRGGGGIGGGVMPYNVGEIRGYDWESRQIVISPIDVFSAQDRNGIIYTGRDLRNLNRNGMLRFDYLNSPFLDIELSNGQFIDLKDDPETIESILNLLP